jgi:hypothetical protein
MNTDDREKRRQKVLNLMEDAQNDISHQIRLRFVKISGKFAAFFGSMRYYCRNFNKNKL